MLYRYVKEVVSNYSTYFLCAEDSFHNKNIKSESCHDTIIGVMVIEKNVVDKSQVNYIIHYICILPKWRRKGYGSYLMGEAFASDFALENVKLYVVTRSMILNPLIILNQTVNMQRKNCVLSVVRI